MISDYPIRLLEREAGAPESVAALIIEMGFDTRPNARKSKKAGYEVHEEVPCIRVTVPGELNKSVREGPIRPDEKVRFPRAYAALMALDKEAPPIDGMPIEHWPRVTRVMAMTLKAANIPTVEAMAAVDDNNISKIGPEGPRLRSEAKAFLQVSHDAAAAQRIQAESDAKDALLADMQRQIRELAAKLEAKDEEPKRGPGRPRKDEAA